MDQEFKVTLGYTACLMKASQPGRVLVWRMLAHGSVWVLLALTSFFGSWGVRGDKTCWSFREAGGRSRKHGRICREFDAERTDRSLGF